MCNITVYLKHAYLVIKNLTQVLYGFRQWLNRLTSLFELIGNMANQNVMNMQTTNLSENAFRRFY